MNRPAGTLWAGRALVLTLMLGLVPPARAWAQPPSVAEPPTAAPTATATATDTAPAPPPAGADSARVAELEARVRQLEVLIQQMASRQQPSATGPATGSNPPSTDPKAATNTVPPTSTPNGDTPSGTPSAVGGPLAPAQGGPPNPAPSARFQMPATTVNAPVTGRFGPGFEFRTADDEFVVQFHNLTQVDGRFYQQGGQAPVRDTFLVPRQWFILSGRITKPYEYFLSFQNAFDVVNMLDVFLNVHYDDRLQLKFGRFKTPFTYEFYVEPTAGLISPENSLFFNNFALNRSVGVMGWGRLFNSTTPLDYAVGLFNNARNSYLDGSDGKDLLAFVNWRPFAQAEGGPLENFVLGGSVMAGSQTNSPVPATLRTVVPTTGNSILGVPFLTWNANTREAGPRAFWDLHAAWYYKHLSLVAEWQSGYQDYALATTLAQHDRVGVGSYYVQAGYFVTGETVAGRGTVKPLRDFDLRRGKRGPGAIELTARYDVLNLSRNVFSAGLADPNLWSNSVVTVEPGFNWYPTQYTKFAFVWNHAVFGEPVLYNSVARQKTSDLFWARFQLYF